jgi:hypothetical protein
VVRLPAALMLRPKIALGVCFVPLTWAVPTGGQELGNKVLGTLGLLAGSQPPSGLYVADRFLLYSANDLIDRNGHRIPVGLDLDALANAIGIQVTFKLPWRSIYVNASLGVPAARVGIQTERPEASIDRYGFGDLYVQPLKIGWKSPRIDIVAGYSFYAPTGRFTPANQRRRWTRLLDSSVFAWERSVLRPRQNVAYLRVGELRSESA